MAMTANDPLHGEPAEVRALTTHLQDALALILESRPHDPIRYLANYFTYVSAGNHELAKAYRICKLCPRKGDCVHDHLHLAYVTLSRGPTESTTAPIESKQG